MVKHHNIMVKKPCKYKLKDGSYCKRARMLGDYCLVHYKMHLTKTRKQRKKDKYSKYMFEVLKW